MVLVGLAAVTLAASAAPAAAQGFVVGVGVGDYGYGGWYGDYGAPWGYGNWGYGSYAAAPCTCGTAYRSVRVAPRYRSYAYGGYPYDYDYDYGPPIRVQPLVWYPDRMRVDIQPMPWYPERMPMYVQPVTGYPQDDYYGRPRFQARFSAAW